MASQFKTFVAGDVLTASEVNTYLMKQAVIVCDSSADYPSSPVEGMFVYDKALDCYLGYTGSAWVRVLPIAVGASQSWTPAITQSGAVTVTVTKALYLRRGPEVTTWVNLSVTGSGSAGNAIACTLPVNADTSTHANTDLIGSGVIIDTGTAVYPCTVNLNSSASQIVFGGGNSGGGNIGQAPSFALASGDGIRFRASYLVA